MEHVVRRGVGSYDQTLGSRHHLPPCTDTSQTFCIGTTYSAYATVTDKLDISYSFVTDKLFTRSHITFKFLISLQMSTLFLNTLTCAELICYLC